MFDPKDMYKWKAPKIEELVMKDVTDFVAKLDDAKATITLYAEEWYPLKCFDTESQWHKWYVEPYGKTKRRIYAFINRDVGSGYMVRPKIHALPKNLPATYDDHEITEKSVLNMVSCDKDLALYYYDMFVRELGMVMAQSYYLFTIDGQVAGTVGFDTRELTMHRKPIIYETFGLSITSERYQRLNRLLMRYITGMEFSNQLMRKWIPPQLFLPHAKYLQTTCLSKYMEVKVNRGLLKLISRKKLPNGRYHLVYKTKLHNEPMKQIVSDWVKKHSEYRRA